MFSRSDLKGGQCLAMRTEGKGDKYQLGMTYTYLLIKLVELTEVTLGQAGTWLNAGALLSSLDSSLFSPFEASHCINLVHTIDEHVSHPF